MDRRAALGALGLVAGAALLTGCGRRPEGTPDRVVVIVIDTLRRDNLPFYGYAKDTAPFLGSLSARSVVFEHAVASSSWTAPATASLFTSLYPFQHGVITGLAASRRRQQDDPTIQINRIPDDARTLPEVMKEAGYETFGIGANLNISEEMGFAQGFDHFATLKDANDARAVGRQLHAFRPALLAARRYFLYLHYMDPHLPNEGRAPLFEPTLEGPAREVSAYDSEIHYCDAQIRKAFRSFGWEKDTLIVMTADHGEGFGEHGDVGHGENLFGEVLNVPLFFYLPGGRGGGRRVADAVSHVDVLPTLRELVGLRPEPGGEGLSLVPLLESRAPSPRARPLFAFLYRPPGHRDRPRETVVEAALDDRWKWIGGTRGGGLFELPRDRGEVLDRSGSEPRVAESLETRYRAFVAQSRKLARVEGSVPMDEKTLETLRALGYVN